MNSAWLWALTAFIPVAAAVAWADTTLVKDRPFKVCARTAAHVNVCHYYVGLLHKCIPK